MTSLQSREDLIEHGDLSALICVDEPNLQYISIDQFSQLSFGIHTALNASEISSKIRGRVYEVIVVYERFGGSDAQTNVALSIISELPLAQRRETYVILVGPNMVSRSDMQAFMYSVDLTLKDTDAGNMKVIAGRGLVRQEELYTTFLSVWKALKAA